MFPQIRALFFSMAGITGLIDSGLAQQKIIIAIVRIVAVTAGHVAKPQGVATGFQGVGTPFWMAVKTGILLGQCVEYPVPGPVYLVACSAGNIGGFMPTSKPSQPAMGFVTSQAHLVLNFSRCFGLATKSVNGLAALTPLLAINMIFARSVTGFTLQAGKGRFGIGP